MSYTQFLHAGPNGYEGESAAFDKKRDWLFSGERRPFLEACLKDFRKLYYDIAPATGLGRKILLRKDPLDNKAFKSSVLIPYIAENLGDTGLLEDTLHDLGLNDPITWSTDLDPRASSDLRGFYFFTHAGTGRSNAQIAQYLSGYISERIEMLCNEAGGSLKRLSFSHQHFVMTRKKWRTGDVIRPSLLAAAGNLAAAIPVEKTEIRCLEDCAEKICASIATNPALADSYRDFLTQEPHWMLKMERARSLRFMRQHFDRATSALRVTPIVDVRARNIDETTDANYGENVVQYSNLRGLGIHRRTRADVFNIGNHELGHHLFKIANGNLGRLGVSRGMRSRVAFNEIFYNESARHFGAYHEQYSERLCDTFAVTLAEKLCGTLKIDFNALMARTDFVILTNEHSKRLILRDNPKSALGIYPYRTEDNFRIGEDGVRREVVYSLTT